MRFLAGTVSLACLLVYLAGSAEMDRSAPVASAAGSPALRPLWTPPPAAGRPADASLSPAVARLAARGDETVRVMLRLAEPPLRTLPGSAGARLAQAERIRRAQDRAIEAVEQRSGRSLARLRNLVSAVVVSIPGRLAPEIAALPGVVGLHPIRDHELHLDATIPYVGADAVHGQGYDGTGIRVAVLDSGIDYTHRGMGGPGTQSAYNAAYFGADPGCVAGTEAVCANRASPDPALVGPGAPKVQGGFDYVGEIWPAGPEEPDANPIDRNGHGTHVADALAGLGYPAGTDGDGVAYPAKGSGVAPGADLYVFKVCSTSTGNCSGPAIAQALDGAMDLDGNVLTFDPAHIVNGSWGSLYGQPEDAIGYLVQQLAVAGVLPVFSAGSSGDRPYIVSSPSSVPGALSVGAVQHPGQTLSFLTSAAGSFPVLRNKWSPAPGGAFTGVIHYGSTAATRLGCNPDGSSPYAPASLVGRITLVDRGTCGFNLKVVHAGQAGARAVILTSYVAQSQNELPGQEPYEGFTVSVPAYTATTAASVALRLGAGGTAFVDPGSDRSVVDAMEGRSSRGPAINDGRIKPDIAGPGGAVSARAGTGSQIAYQSGTSMSTPHVAGAAALLMQANPSLFSDEVKVILMNTARRDVYADGRPENGGGYPAPITWTGAGIVDAQAAVNAATSGVLAWTETTPGDFSTAAGSVSFGYQPVTSTTTVVSRINVLNFAAGPISVTLTVAYRDPVEASHVTFDTGGPTVVEPAAFGSTVVEPGAFGSMVLTATIAASDLPPWDLDKGAQGYNGRAFDDEEKDGTLTLDTSEAAADPKLAWQVLPKKAADVSGVAVQVPEPGVVGTVMLINGAPSADGEADIFSLVDESANLHNFRVGDCASIGQSPGCGQSPVDLRRVGVRDRVVDLDGTGAKRWMEFAATFWDPPYRAAQLPTRVEVRVDGNRDGFDDHILFNSPLVGADGYLEGRNAVFLYNLGTGLTQFVAFTDSDYNTQNFILPVPASSLGLAPGDAFDFYVNAWEIYFQGMLWDCSPFPSGPDPCGTDRHTHTVTVPRFRVDDANLVTTVPAGGSVSLPVTSTLTTAAASPSGLGFVVLYPKAVVGRESDALALRVAGVDEDGDGRPDAEDCAPADPEAFAVPGEVTNVAFGSPFVLTDTIIWDSAAPTSGAGTTHQVFRESGGSGAVGNAPDGELLATVSGNRIVLPEVPPVGTVWRIMVRGSGPCGAGTWGSASDGTPRSP
jgi:subtilisin family serine protease